MVSVLIVSPQSVQYFLNTYEPFSVHEGAFSSNFSVPIVCTCSFFALVTSIVTETVSKLEASVPEYTALAETFSPSTRAVSPFSQLQSVISATSESFSQSLATFITVAGTFAGALAFVIAKFTLTASKV